MREHFVFITLVLLPVIFLGQTKTDSLISILDSSPDSAKIELLNEISYEYCWNNLDSAIQFGKRALDLAERLGDKRNKSVALYNLGLAEKRNANFDLGINYLEKAITVSYETKDTLQLAKCYSELANVILAEGEDYPKALENYQVSLNFAESIENQKQVGATLNNIALVHEKMNNLEKSLEYHKRSYEVKKNSNNSRGMAFSLTNMGGIYRKMGEVDKAIECYNDALPLAIPTGHNLLIAVLNENLGVAYCEKKEYMKGIRSYKNALEGFDKIGDKIGVAIAYYNIADAYMFLNNTEESFKYARLCMELAQEIESSEQLLDSYRIYHLLYSKIGDYKSAYDYQSLYLEKYTDAFTESQNREIAEMEAKYETEKKQNQINLLNKENELQAVTIAKQEITIWGTILLVLSFAGFAAFIFRQNKNLQKSNRELVKKNLELIKCDQKSVPVPKLTGSVNDELIDDLSVLLAEKEIYKTHKLTIDMLAKELNTNRTYLSEVINKHFNTNFNQFINEYRIREARKLLACPENQILTIEAIAGMVGFTTKSVFNEAFKKYTGISPSFFRENALIEQNKKSA